MNTRAKTRAKIKQVSTTAISLTARVLPRATPLIEGELQEMLILWRPWDRKEVG